MSASRLAELLCSGFSDQGLVLGVLGTRVQVSLFRVQGLGFRV